MTDIKRFDHVGVTVTNLDAGLVGGIGEYESTWRTAYVRGPDGVIVALAEQIGRTQPDTDAEGIRMERAP
jgi:hypothetical protein